MNSENMEMKICKKYVKETENRKFWKIFWEYIRARRKIICLIVIIVLMETVLNYLYHVPIEMTLYFGTLLAFVLILGICIGFYRYRKRHLELVYLQSKILLNMERLPHPEDLLEHDYQELTKILEQALTELRTDTGKSAHEMTDYYTLWVHQIKTPIAAMRLILQEEDSEKNRELSSELFRIEQ